MFIKNLANLIKVKTIVTLILTVVFSVMAVQGKVGTEQFIVIFTTVIAFYFGTQAEKNKNESEDK